MHIATVELSSYSNVTSPMQEVFMQVLDPIWDGGDIITKFVYCKGQTKSFLLGEQSSTEPPTREKLAIHTGLDGHHS